MESADRTTQLLVTGRTGAGITQVLVPTASPGVTITPLAHATIAARVHTKSGGIQIKTHRPKDMLVTSITVDPAGSFGWHTHPGPVLVSVASGTLSLYHAEHQHCDRDTIPAGQGFIEDGGDVHLARNEGTSTVQLYVTFLAPTGTTDFLTEVAKGRETVRVVLPEGASVEISPRENLKPLPELDGFVPDGWKDAIYNR